MWGGVKILRPINYVLYFGRYVEEKGVKTLCNAAKQNQTIRFVFAGKGPLSANIKEGNNLVDVGFQTSQQIKRLILNSSFCVCPSECYETFGLSVGEALMLGKKVIASNLGGIAEQINSDNGFIFEGGNTNDLSEKIQKLWSYGRIQQSKTANVFGAKRIEYYYEQIKKIYSA